MPKTGMNDVVFIKSSPDERSCPKDNLPEFAFLGRSNVGKSSLINYISGQNKLARTSSQPGRTRLINHFLADNTWYIVDLPGYGYAKIPKEERGKIRNMIEQYLLQRKSLICLFLLIDCRHAPQPVDLRFMRWLGENLIPFVICFTKTDKLGSNQLNNAVEKYKVTLLKEWDTLPEIFFTSALKRTGRDEVLRFINKTLKAMH
ncbi:MAG: ribosome biogenesis GTP-binding protein YihA/YsxC [Bacteroidales bacterium]|jgi:GTP-binding protein